VSLATPAEGDADMGATNNDDALSWAFRFFLPGRGGSRLAARQHVLAQQEKKSADCEFTRPRIS